MGFRSLCRCVLAGPLCDDVAQSPGEPSRVFGHLYHRKRWKRSKGTECGLICSDGRRPAKTCWLGGIGRGSGRRQPLSVPALLVVGRRASVLSAQRVTCGMCKTASDTRRSVAPDLCSRCARTERSTLKGRGGAGGSSRSPNPPLRTQISNCSTSPLRTVLLPYSIVPSAKKKCY